MNKKASLGLAIILGAAGSVAIPSEQSVKTSEQLIRNLNEGQATELIQLLNDLKSESPSWEAAGPSSGEPSKCFAT